MDSPRVVTFTCPDLHCKGGKHCQANQIARKIRSMADKDPNANVEVKYVNMDKEVKKDFHERTQAVAKQCFKTCYEQYQTALVEQNWVDVAVRGQHCLDMLRKWLPNDIGGQVSFITSTILATFYSGCDTDGWQLFHKFFNKEGKEFLKSKNANAFKLCAAMFPVVMQTCDRDADVRIWVSCMMETFQHQPWTLKTLQLQMCHFASLCKVLFKYDLLSEVGVALNNQMTILEKMSRNKQATDVEINALVFLVMVKARQKAVMKEKNKFQETMEMVLGLCPSTGHGKIKMTIHFHGLFFAIQNEWFDVVHDIIQNIMKDVEQTSNRCGNQRPGFSGHG